MSILFTALVSYGRHRSQGNWNILGLPVHELACRPNDQPPFFRINKSLAEYFELSDPSETVLKIG